MPKNYHIVTFHNRIDKEIWEEYSNILKKNKENNQLNVRSSPEFLVKVDKDLNQQIDTEFYMKIQKKGNSIEDNLKKNYRCQEKKAE